MVDGRVGDRASKSEQALGDRIASSDGGSLAESPLPRLGWGRPWGTSGCSSLSPVGLTALPRSEVDFEHVFLREDDVHVDTVW